MRWPSNIALEPTPYSLRSYVAAASGRGSPRALGAKSVEEKRRGHAVVDDLYAPLALQPTEDSGLNLAKISFTRVRSYLRFAHF